MPRYADIDKVLNNIPVDEIGNTDYLTLEKTLIKCTADVVPKSEVERLQAEKDALIKNYAECMKDCARGIFAEIFEDCFDQFGYINYEALFKLKNKYVGGEQ